MKISLENIAGMDSRTTKKNILSNEIIVLRKISQKYFPRILTTAYISKDAKVGAIVGECGSGKSETSIIKHIHDYLIFGRLPLQIVLQTQHAIGYTQSIKDFDKKYWKPVSKLLKLEVRPLTSLNAKDLIFDDYNNVIDTQEITKHLDKNYFPEYIPFIISISHQEQLKKIMVIFSQIRSEAMDSNSYYMRGINAIFDESHKSLNIKENTIHFGEEDCYFENTDTWKNIKLSKYELSEFLSAVFPDSQVTAMTATPAQDLFTKPIEFYIEVEPNNHYVSLVTTPVSFIKPLEKDVSPVDDPDLWRRIKEWSKMGHFDSKKFNLEKKHPLYSLITVEPTQEGMKKIIDNIHTKYPGKFCTIINICSGFIVRVNDEVAKAIREEHKRMIKVDDGTNTDIAYIDNENTLKFKAKIGVSAILQIFSDFSDKIPRIISIAWGRVLEGIRNNSTDYFLAPTFGYVRVPKTMKGDALEQLYARAACGIRMHGLKPKMYCLQKDHEKVIVNHRFNQDAIKYLVLDSFGKSCDVLKKTTVSEKRLRGYKLCKAPIPMKETNLSSDDFGDKKSIAKIDEIINQTETDDSKRKRAKRIRKAQEEAAKRVKTDAEETYIDSEWVRINGRLLRNENESCISFLKRLIKTYSTNTKKGKMNKWKTAKEWLNITGLCGFESKDAYHMTIMTKLVNQEFMQRNDSNKLRFNNSK